MGKVRGQHHNFRSTYHPVVLMFLGSLSCMNFGKLLFASYSSTILEGFCISSFCKVLYVGKLCEKQHEVFHNYISVVFHPRVSLGISC